MSPAQTPCQFRIPHTALGNVVVEASSVSSPRSSCEQLDSCWDSCYPHTVQLSPVLGTAAVPKPV